MDEQEFRKKISESHKIIADTEAQFLDPKGHSHFTIERLEPVLEQPCEWCGKLKTCHLVYKMFYANPKPHWRTKCRDCQQWRHPNGCEMIPKGEVSHHVYVRFLRELNINSGDD